MGNYYQTTNIDVDVPQPEAKTSSPQTEPIKKQSLSQSESLVITSSSQSKTAVNNSWPQSRPKISISTSVSKPNHWISLLEPKLQSNPEPKPPAQEVMVKAKHTDGICTRLSQTFNMHIKHRRKKRNKHVVNVYVHGDGEAIFRLNKVDGLPEEEAKRVKCCLLEDEDNNDENRRDQKKENIDNRKKKISSELHSLSTEVANTSPDFQNQIFSEHNYFNVHHRCANNYLGVINQVTNGH